MKATKLLKSAILLLSFLSFALVSCEKQGPAEEAGENLDEAMEEAGENLDEAGEEVSDEIDAATDN